VGTGDITGPWTMFVRITLCVKKVPPLVCYNFDTCERILIFFGGNVIDEVNNQDTLLFHIK